MCRGVNTSDSHQKDLSEFYSSCFSAGVLPLMVKKVQNYFWVSELSPSPEVTFLITQRFVSWLNIVFSKAVKCSSTETYFLLKSRGRSLLFKEKKQKNNMCKRTLGLALEVFKNHLLTGHASKQPQMLEQEAQWPHCVCPFLVATELNSKLLLGNEVTITLMINSRTDQTLSLHKPYLSFQKVKVCS